MEQFAVNVWFEHFSNLFYHKQLPPSLPELDEREVSGLTDEISIDEVIAATRHCKHGKAAGPDGIDTDVIKDCSTSLVWSRVTSCTICGVCGVKEVIVTLCVRSV